MGAEQPEPSEDSIYFLEKQKVSVGAFEACGFILDIGGGGEGIIGQVKGKQVVAIDPSRRELLEAADGPLKVVMDARDLMFLDETFGVVTSFFTLMYIKGPEHGKVFREVLRVLEPGGRFLVWDVELPARQEEARELVAFYLRVLLPDREIDTGYGTHWPAQIQGLAYYKDLAEVVGFDVSAHEQNGRVFFLELRKP
jgi:SAM-dependent methyltransferase